MKEYSFSSAEGIEVTVKVEGGYHGCPDKDLFIEAGNGFEAEISECGDGEDVLDALEEAGLTFENNPRHFAEHVITACMILEEETLEEALDYQAKWESEN